MSFMMTIGLLLGMIIAILSVGALWTFLFTYAWKRRRASQWKSVICGLVVGGLYPGVTFVMIGGAFVAASPSDRSVLVAEALMLPASILVHSSLLLVVLLNNIFWATIAYGVAWAVFAGRSYFQRAHISK